ncbi:MAG: malonyl-ACP O-methyltransferase BioC [Colwelliaceae bacterium]|jgi:malonyl-CoA O-methyltransferase|nr:malonyl-ACP O-methyltransferase BioC [Colwelliaceae bacterium]
MPEKKKLYNIARSFGSASESYDISARLQRYSGKNLMPWLPNRNDLTVLDLGCGTGFFTDILATRYQQVIGLDISSKMLNFSKSNRSDDIFWVEANAYKLPFADQSIDLIYSNLMIQWCESLVSLKKEINRVLKPGGLFIFSTLVDGTLFELKSSWGQVDDDKHVIDFKNESELELIFNTEDSKLIDYSIRDIVLEYENVLHLAKELKGLGANQVPTKQSKGLAGKDKWKKMMQCYQDFLEPSGIYPATYKVFSGLMVKLND